MATAWRNNLRSASTHLRCALAMKRSTSRRLMRRSERRAHIRVLIEAFRADEPEYDRRVICEHSQYAFDGGPTVLGDAAASLASMGYDLHIEWMQR